MTEYCGQEMRQSSRMAGVDVDFDPHPGAQGRQILIGRVDSHPHRNALDDLHPIAAGILSGQKREFLRSRRTHALHGAGPCVSGYVSTVTSAAWPGRTYVSSVSLGLATTQA